MSAAGEEGLVLFHAILILRAHIVPVDNFPEVIDIFLKLGKEK
jgi:hypothetical protein